MSESLYLQAKSVMSEIIEKAKSVHDELEKYYIEED